MYEWQFISDAAEACRRVGSRRDMGREEWLAHYAKLRTIRAGRHWYTGVIGHIYGCRILRSDRG